MSVCRQFFNAAMIAFTTVTVLIRRYRRALLFTIGDGGVVYYRGIGARMRAVYVPTEPSSSTGCQGRHRSWLWRHQWVVRSRVRAAAGASSIQRFVRPSGHSLPWSTSNAGRTPQQHRQHGLHHEARTLLRTLCFWFMWLIVADRIRRLSVSHSPGSPGLIWP